MSEDNPGIGWYYRLLGALTLVAMLTVIFWKFWYHEQWAKTELMLVGGLFVATLALIRPDLFDKMFKDVLDYLPFVKYRHPPEGPTSG